MISRTLVRAKKPLEAIGQLAGHVKSGIEIPKGARTTKPMALVSALPFAPDSDKLVLVFLDRSDPVETFDYKPGSGDNAVVIAPRSEVSLSIIKGVSLGDWRGMKVDWGDEIEEPVDLDVDPTGLDLDRSDAWVDMVDELGCDCTKVGGYPLWSNAPVDVDAAMGKPMRFHHRLTNDIVEWNLGEGGAVIYVFVDEAGEEGCVLWQETGGGSEQTYHHYQ
ncbi:MAG: hypothetical protein PF961_09605 [Planctomycetota bacterium]|jgi:hypothetical protein|nr:hypothetical protein [Planctomycetota bacterium]